MSWVGKTEKRDVVWNFDTALKIKVTSVLYWIKTITFEWLLNSPVLIFFISYKDVSWGVTKSFEGMFTYEGRFLGFWQLLNLNFQHFYKMRHLLQQHVTMTRVSSTCYVPATRRVFFFFFLPPKVSLKAGQLSLLQGSQHLALFDSAWCYSC